MNDHIKDTLFQLSEDVYNYIVRLAPLLLCFGFALSMIQKTVRFIYYKIDPRYLMEIRTEEVLQEVAYLFPLICYSFYAYSIYKRIEKLLNISEKFFL